MPVLAKKENATHVRITQYSFRRERVQIVQDNVRLLKISNPKRRHTFNTGSRNPMSKCLSIYQGTLVEVNLGL